MKKHNITSHQRPAIMDISPQIRHYQVSLLEFGLFSPQPFCFFFLIPPWFVDWYWSENWITLWFVNYILRSTFQGNCCSCSMVIKNLASPMKIVIFIWWILWCVKLINNERKQSISLFKHFSSVALNVSYPKLKKSEILILLIGDELT